MHLCILIESQHTHSQQSFASRDTTLRVGRPFMLSSEALATICNRDAVACKYANVMATRNGETPTMCSAKSGECHEEAEEAEASVVARPEKRERSKKKARVIGLLLSHSFHGNCSWFCWFSFAFFGAQFVLATAAATLKPF